MCLRPPPDPLLEENQSNRLSECKPGHLRGRTAAVVCYLTVFHHLKTTVMMCQLVREGPTGLEIVGKNDRYLLAAFSNVYVDGIPDTVAFLTRGLVMMGE